MSLDNILDFGDEDEDDDVVTSSVSNYKDTEDHIKQYFDGRTKIGKSDIFLYSDKRTLFGDKIKSTDIILMVHVLNMTGYSSNKFISISPRIIKHSEIKRTSRKYINIGHGKRTPRLVERKFMEHPNYVDAQQKIIEQFL